MITGPNGTITLDPNRLVVAGDHRYQIIQGGFAPQVWTCTRCGDRRHPSDPYVECAAGPVTS